MWPTACASQFTEPIQYTHVVISDASGTHLIGIGLTFPRDSRPLYVRVIRLLARSVGKGPRKKTIYADLLRQLRHPIPPPPQAPSPSRFSIYNLLRVPSFQSPCVWGYNHMRRRLEVKRHPPAEPLRYVHMAVPTYVLFIAAPLHAAHAPAPAPAPTTTPPARETLTARLFEHEPGCLQRQSYRQSLTRLHQHP